VPAASALTPEAAVERLARQSAEIRAAALLDEHGQGAAGDSIEDFATLGEQLFRMADAAASRAGIAEIEGVEVARPEGGVYGLRARDPDGRLWTLIAVAAGGALSSLVFYDLRMTIRALGAAR
jgi:hypothetical protein